jgi:hypothetical protein
MPSGSNDIERATVNAWAIRADAKHVTASADAALTRTRLVRRRTQPLVGEIAKHADLHADVQVINETILGIGDLLAGIEEQATRLAKARRKQEMLSDVAKELAAAKQGHEEMVTGRRRAAEEALATRRTVASAVAAAAAASEQATAPEQPEQAAPQRGVAVNGAAPSGDGDGGGGGDTATLRDGGDADGDSEVDPGEHSPASLDPACEEIDVAGV